MSRLVLDSGTDYGLNMKNVRRIVQPDILDFILTVRCSRLGEVVILSAVLAIATVEAPLTVAIAKTANIAEPRLQKITAQESRVT